jgi:hypothetical protein
MLKNTFFLLQADWKRVVIATITSDHCGYIYLLCSLRVDSQGAIPSLAAASG